MRIEEMNSCNKPGSERRIDKHRRRRHIHLIRKRHASVFVSLCCWVTWKLGLQLVVIAFSPSQTFFTARKTVLRQSASFLKISSASEYPLLPNPTQRAASAPSSTTLSSPPGPHEGLSKLHQSILSRTSNRQRVVTGRYPLKITLYENPTRKWLNLGRTDSANAVTEILVNGTTPLRSLASLDRFLWLDEEERNQLTEDNALLTVELLAEIRMERPGYLHILPTSAAGLTAEMSRRAGGGKWTNRWKQQQTQQQSALLLGQEETQRRLHRDRLWVTGFSLAGRQGLVKSFDSDSGYIDSVNARTAQSMLWPNEVNAVPAQLLSPRTKTKSTSTPAISNAETHQDALLVCDGFLVPGKDRGGLYVVKNPGNPHTEWTVCLTPALAEDRWFYHRAVWIDLTGDGRKSILTARCKVTTVLNNNGGVTSGIRKWGELVWLECPQPASIDPDSGTPLEDDGVVFDPFAARHLPWKVHVLEEGPDVMFSVADLESEDDTIEVIASHFFGKKITVSSIKRGKKPSITFQRTIDDNCGSAFGCILAHLDVNEQSNHVVVDAGSTVSSLESGDSFSHLLVTSHECSYVEKEASDISVSKSSKKTNGIVTDGSTSEGGSLFAYTIPRGDGKWRTEPWTRSVIASGFKVNGQLSNMINPGAPGFVYTFHARKDESSSTKRPLIAVAGDCADSAYIFRPRNIGISVEKSLERDANAAFDLMLEIECGATVGSIGIGYDDFGSLEQESGFAKLYVPCFEKDKILVFALGSGEDDYNVW